MNFNQVFTMNHYSTEERIALYHGDMEQLVRHNLPEFQRVHLGRTDVSKWMHVLQENTGNYLLMVSRSENPDPTYNMILTVHGPKQERTSSLMKDLELRVGFSVQPAPEALIQRWKTLFPRISEMMGIK